MGACATHRQLCDLRLQYLSRLQNNIATDIAAVGEPIAALVSQEQTIITNRTNEDLMQDLGNLMKDRHKLSEYANNLEQKTIEKDKVVL